MGSHQDIWVSGLISGQCYGSVLSSNFQCKNKSRWHGSRWHGNSSGSSIKAKRREGWGGKSLFELVSSCRQLVIPLELSAFKFILLSHLQVIPRREMNIISMSVYFVFGTRRTHKNKRQILPPQANDTPLTNHLSPPPRHSSECRISLNLNGKSIKTFFVKLWNATTFHMVSKVLSW